jgi:hypothetical protein
MKLPNAENAKIPDGKLKDHSLDLNHIDGGHKARVFKAALGFVRSDWETVALLIRNLVPFFEAELKRTSNWGRHYQVDIWLTG